MANRYEWLRRMIQQKLGNPNDSITAGYYDGQTEPELILTQATDTLDALTHACRGITQKLSDKNRTAPLARFHIVVMLTDGTAISAQGENLST